MYQYISHLIKINKDNDKTRIYDIYHMLCDRLHFPRMATPTCIPFHMLFLQCDIMLVLFHQRWDFISSSWTCEDLCNCLNQWDVLEIMLHDFKGCHKRRYNFHLALSLLRHLSLDTSHHVSRKTRSHGEVMCVYVFWLTGPARPPADSHHQLPDVWVNNYSCNSSSQTLNLLAEAPDIEELR